MNKLLGETTDRGGRAGVSELRIGGSHGRLLRDRETESATVGVIRAQLPVHEEAAVSCRPEAAVEGDGVAGVESLLPDEAAPFLGHVASPEVLRVGAAEAPLLPVGVLEGKHEHDAWQEGPDRIFLGDDQPFPHVGRRQHLVEQVLLPNGGRRRCPVAAASAIAAALLAELGSSGKRDS